ncbi:primosomal protein N' [Microbacterium sp. SORGH_AS_0888]|uniref:primosomal protein N' family DNA-binding protein n=1 Tax=Microbacterium sp. SORGH_AS_0888 TaxID=3041791 RepID=UPI00278B3E9F|nr:primosomal protein N' [Microbacterium sp. SORGH_AS_0888]MDQ1128508.1 primosomal protein N' (replication factor Y) [Microbacterium sp. SORGH_AS_0888]
MSARRVARVLIDSPLPQLDRLFDYDIPPELVDAAVPGVRVKVPLRSLGRVVDGYLVEVGEAADAERPLSALDVVVSPARVLPERLYRVARRVADRAAGSASDVLRLVIPRRMVRAEKAWAAAPAPAAPEVAPETLRWAQEVLGAYPGLTSALAAGERLAVDAPPRPLTLPDGTVIGAWAVLLCAAAVSTLAQGHSAVLVVPDHRDQEQLAAALAAHLPGDAVVRDDARRPAPARYAAYLRVLADAPCVVIGNRSAVYSPAARTGLVAIWNDGDPLLGEPLSPGVHARDAALVRQELEGGALLFAGHTRTTDVERLVAVGWVRDVPAVRRQSPRVVLSAPADGLAQARIPSQAFAAVREALTTGPVLVQVARPGYAPVVVCADCRRPARCVHCTGPLRVRSARRLPECSWCGRAATGWRCGHCEGSGLRLASAGSERTADELGRAFPNTRVIVADADHPVTQVEGRPALVVATRGAEPLADGGYRAVLLLDGDRMLLAEDLRIGEFCLRWWSDAAALVAPGAPVHLVGVTGPVARALATWTQPAYARSELAERAPLKMPPAVRVASLEGSPASVSQALETLRAEVPGLAPDAVIGPARQPGEDPPLDRALVRFEYAQGSVVCRSLRASVVADAVRGRRPRRGGPGRPTLRVRVDVPDPDL